MFKAIIRYFRAIGYLIAGNIDAARQAVSSNPHVIEAKYEDIIQEKTKNIQRYKDAVSRMIVQEEKKIQKIKSLTEEVGKYERMKAGAAAKAKALVGKYGGDVAKVKSDPEYVKCQAAYKDFSSTLEDKQKQCEEIEDDLEGLTTSITEHKNNIQGLLRDIQKIKEEKHTTVAEVISAKEEQQISDMLSGVSTDRHMKELAEMRDMRQAAKAKAKMSREMAGLDTKKDEEDFLAYANVSVVNDEFDELIGLPKPEQKQIEAENGKV